MIQDSSLAQVQSQSLQTRLSSINSLQRIRASGSHSDDVQELQGEFVKKFEENHVQQAPVSSGPDFDLPVPSTKASTDSVQHRQTLKFLKWILYAYAGFCLWYSTFYFLRRLRVTYHDLHEHAVSPNDGPYSAFQTTLSPHRFSRLSLLYEQSISFSPNFVQADFTLDRPTACVWTRDTNSTSIRAFHSVWSGPISLLLVTTESPMNQDTTALLSNLSALNIRRSDGPVFAHVLVVHSSTQDSPNAYLNLARLYAPAQSVVLFPDDLSTLPAFSSSALAELLSDWETPSVLIKTDNHASFPFEPLSPIMLSRDHPLWCDERFISGSRELDWAECLWKLWLETFGEVPVYNTAHWSNVSWTARTTSVGNNSKAVGALTVGGNDYCLAL
ncbi:hypothetical protein NEOLEDRAFT_1179478 [Neolentinus lepideus HHB14362 ss-1]|uniref:Uncharacterized protein n=1 Tax=Neolentinus lepideus HHB14362 ss-1 TaxID=1314782 RepID=A0A165RT06_9AGAM|nr:hypothetical protein NEOLEDRAFT_1179478 [Neolentinus lepideus HHB14362 ss-1]